MEGMMGKIGERESERRREGQRHLAIKSKDRDSNSMDTGRRRMRG